MTGGMPKYPLESIGEPLERRRWTIIAPGTTGVALGVALGSLGWFGVAFGQGTVCTDFNEAPHACHALYRWLEIGFIGQWVLVLASAVLLALGLKRPQKRTRASIAAWATIVMAIGWFSICYHGTYDSFKVHH